MKVAHCGSGQLAVHQGTGEAKYPPRSPTYGGRAAYKEAVEQVHLSVMFFHYSFRAPHLSQARLGGRLWNRSN